MNDRDAAMPALPLVGLVPMAGHATRLAQLSCSKEIVPLPVPPDAGPERPPQVICEQLLGKMHAAGIDNIYVVLREGKWDIPTCLGDGSRAGVNIAYLMMGLPWGTPYSADQAYPFVRDAIVALGFPDMLFGPENIFARLIDYQRATVADVALGLFPTDRPDKVDMVDMDADGKVRQIIIKPAASELRYTWGIALWTPAFTQFMHAFLADHQHGAADAPELFIGDVIRAAMRKGLTVRGIPVSGRPFLDIGTPEDLQRARIRSGRLGTV